jgi:hypothetical protein
MCADDLILGMADVGKPEPSEAERLVLAEVRACPGLDFALPVDEVASRTGLERRVVEHIVKHLIEEHGLPIGSATGDPHGYFWITTAEEQASSERQLENRIKSIARRLARLRKNTPHAILLQLSLDLETESVVGAHGRAPDQAPA